MSITIVNKNGMNSRFLSFLSLSFDSAFGSLEINLASDGAKANVSRF